MGSFSRKTIPISNNCSLCVLLICMVALFTIAIMNTIMYEGLLIRGINWVYTLQTAQPQKSFQVFYNLFAQYNSTVGAAINITFYLILVERKLKVLIHVSYFLLCTYLMALIKVCTQETRPIWYDSRIYQW